ncbi:MAG: hypothetical protein HYT62_00335 [Candidatus Yanofskybacteria bacterium]|nr:hypothetical protein [Candidatus Yanofskybacteria bacterium]
MKRLKIVLLLHFYQPWWQPSWMIKKIANECYRPILNLIEEFEGFCFTANINLSLLVHLEEHCPDIVDGFRRAIKNGKLELTGSTAQHPIMPLIPEFVQKAQIEEDRDQKEIQFDLKPNCSGFFLPELAFSTKVVGLLKNYNYRWTVMDDEPFVATYGKNSVPFNSVISWDGFKVFMRSNYWSNMISSGKYSFGDIKAIMEHEIPSWTGNVPAYLIIAMDAETFGHHHCHLIDTFLRPMLREWVGLPTGQAVPFAQAGNKIVSIESLSVDFPERQVHYLSDGSWSTSVHDIKRNNPFPLWSSKVNIDRYRLWKLVNLALTHFEQARDECLRITSSCHWWWISRSGWEPELMQKGAELAFSILTEEEKVFIQDDYNELMALKKHFVHKDSE